MNEPIPERPIADNAAEPLSRTPIAPVKEAADDKGTMTGQGKPAGIAVPKQTGQIRRDLLRQARHPRQQKRA